MGHRALIDFSVTRLPEAALPQRGFGLEIQTLERLIEANR